MKSSSSSVRPISVILLFASLAVEGLGFLGAGVLVLVKFGRLGVGSGLLLLALGAAILAVLRAVWHRSLAGHKAMVFFQTFVLIVGFSFVGGPQGYAPLLIGLGAATLVAGFWPATRLWFEAAQPRTP